VSGLSEAEDVLEFAKAELAKLKRRTKLIKVCTDGLLRFYRDIFMIFRKIL